jgi:hypothetical protein
MGTGALSLVETALQASVAKCFANPGSTELPIVVAHDLGAGMSVVLKPLDPEKLGHTLPAFTPEITKIVKERATTLAWPGGAVHASSAAPQTVLGLTGAPSARG